MTDKHFKCDKCGLELKVFFGDCIEHSCVDGKLVKCDESRGLGDTVAKITKAFGVKPCGKCKKRQETLNRMVPYKKKDKK